MTAKKDRAGSPKILSLQWGAIEVETIGNGKDFILWPGGGRKWDWRQSGTRHSPGIRIEDCREIVENGCRYAVLSRGILLRLKVPTETVAYLEENGIEVIVAGTKKAVVAYNLLVEKGEAVGGLFHSTC